MAGKKQFINDLISRMTLDEKVGQCITFEFAGTRVDSHAYDKIQRHHCAGLRVTPHIYTEEAYGTRHLTTGERIQRFAPYAAPREYALILNQVQQIALDSRLGIPLYFSIDQEGDYSQDMARGGVNLFPSQMGLTATGSDEMVHQTYRAVARQLRAMGLRMLHTPCLDVNVEPQNPEIYTRSFSDDPEAVSRLGLEYLRALKLENMIATGKHFPGRGNSMVDVHMQTDVNPGSRQQLWDIDLAPYRALIAAGLPAIMTAHTIYPALDDSNKPASVSRRITTDLLRKELGFRGVITTDAMEMKGVVDLFGSLGQACAEAVAAGADLVLAKTEAVKRDDVFNCIKRYVEEGRIPTKELEAHNRRVLGLKWDYGMFKKPLVNAERAAAPTRDPKIIQLCKDVAARCCILLRDRENLLPLPADMPVLVSQQRCDIYQKKGDDYWWHPNMLQEFVRRHAKTVYDYETQSNVSEEDVKNTLTLAEKVQAVIILCGYNRSVASNLDLARKLIAAGKKVVVVSNTPYPLSCPDEAGTIVLTFSTMPASLEHAANVIYGKAACQGVWPLKNYRVD